ARRRPARSRELGHEARLRVAGAEDLRLRARARSRRGPAVRRLDHGPHRVGQLPGPRPGLPVPARQGQLDRGRHVRDHAQRRGRARPGPAGRPPPRQGRSLQRGAPMSTSDLLYTDVEESLRSSVRGALQRVVEPGAVADLYDAPKDDAPAWSALTGLGLAGLLIPEDLGGAGASAREVAVVLEELGRTVAPAPFLESAVIATSVLLAVGDDDLLRALAAGEKRAVLVLPWSARAGAWSPAEGEAVAPVAGA